MNDTWDKPVRTPEFEETLRAIKTRIEERRSKMFTIFIDGHEKKIPCADEDPGDILMAVEAWVRRGSFRYAEDLGLYHVTDAEGRVIEISLGLSLRLGPPQ